MKDIQAEIDRLVTSALEEDIGPGDVTTESVIGASAITKGIFRAKQEGIVAGWQIVKKVFHKLDPGSRLEIAVPDGAKTGNGVTIASVEGTARALLSGERTALNFLQRMSGIATATRLYVEKVRHTKAVILDTRKTAPGMRITDKLAVVHGGGKNHRAGLYDMALLKENHIAVAGGIAQAVHKVIASAPKNLQIEVEVRTLEELREALTLPIHRIMLDNMDTETMRDAVHITGGKVPLEASGNVTLDTVSSIAETGVDFISVGSLTHSVKALDISLIFESVKELA